MPTIELHPSSALQERKEPVLAGAGSAIYPAHLQVQPNLGRVGGHTVSVTDSEVVSSVLVTRVMASALVTVHHVLVVAILVPVL